MMHGIDESEKGGDGVEGGQFILFRVESQINKKAQHEHLIY